MHIFLLPILFQKTKNLLSQNFKLSRRGAGQGVQSMIPPQMRQQINQQVGQAVTNAAMNELTNVFASRFK